MGLATCIYEELLQKKSRYIVLSCKKVTIILTAYHCELIMFGIIL